MRITVNLFLPVRAQTSNFTQTCRGRRPRRPVVHDFFPSVHKLQISRKPVGVGASTTRNPRFLPPPCANSRFHTTCRGHSRMARYPRFVTHNRFVCGIFNPTSGRRGRRPLRSRAIFAALFAETALCHNYSSVTHSGDTFPRKGRPITSITLSTNRKLIKFQSKMFHPSVAKKQRI